MPKRKDKVWLGPELPGGTRPLFRETPEGERSVGYTGPKGSLPRVDSELDLEHVEGCMYEVTGEVKFTAAGPSQVASPAYRDGWSRIFGAKAPVGQA